MMKQIKNGSLKLSNNTAKTELSTWQYLMELTLLGGMIKTGILLLSLTFCLMLLLLALICLSVMTMLIMPRIVLRFIIQKKNEFLLTLNSLTNSNFLIILPISLLLIKIIFFPLKVSIVSSISFLSKLETPLNSIFLMEKKLLFS